MASSEPEVISVAEPCDAKELTDEEAEDLPAGW
jgi:hypothetical protein